MSVEMEKGFVNDMAVLSEDGNINYVDNVPDDPTPAVDVMDVEAKVVEDAE